MSQRARRRLLAATPIALILVVAAVVLGASAPPARNFSGYPGFAEHYREHPRSSESVSAEDRALLARHRPRFMLPAGHDGPIGFYQDYVAASRLRAGDGSRVPGPIDRARLNRLRDDPRAVLIHDPEAAPRVPTPRVPARIARVRVDVGAGRVPLDLTLLTYHMVFARSGLPAGLPRLQAFALALLGDIEDWHQLDHYTFATVVLARGRPAALLLQQHNGVRTHLIGETVPEPEDGRVAIDVALRSNELYPHVPGRRERPAVRFPTPAAIRYLMGFAPAPTFSAVDVTDSRAEASYELEFLPDDDAFYAFQGYLGELRMLPGRDGPPGADYNTLPALEPWEVQLFVGYWREGNRGDLERFERARANGSGLVGFAAAQAAVFADNLSCLRAGARCALR